MNSVQKRYLNILSFFLVPVFALLYFIFDREEVFLNVVIIILVVTALRILHWLYIKRAVKKRMATRK